MPPDNKTILELTEKEAKLFLRFREYQDIWEQVFKIRNGQAILDFDSSGNIKASVKYPIKRDKATCG
jgi:hypothetical protein